MVQDEFQTKESIAPLSKKRQNRCGDDVYSSQRANTNSKPVRSIGRWYDPSVKDTKIGQETAQFATEGLLAINRCGLQSQFKLWCQLSLLIPKLLWPLLICEICSTTVEAIEAKIDKFTMRWLGVPVLRVSQKWQCTAEKQN